MRRIFHSVSKYCTKSCLKKKKKKQYGILIVSQLESRLTHQITYRQIVVQLKTIIVFTCTQYIKFISDPRETLFIHFQKYKIL